MCHQTTESPTSAFFNGILIPEEAENVEEERTNSYLTTGGKALSHRCRLD